MPPISLDGASLAALRDLSKLEVAAAVKLAAPGSRLQAPTTRKGEELVEIIN